MEVLEAFVYVIFVVMPFFMQAQIFADNKTAIITSMVVGVICNSLFFV